MMGSWMLLIPDNLCLGHHRVNISRQSGRGDTFDERCQGASDIVCPSEGSGQAKSMRPMDLGRAFRCLKLERKSDFYSR